MRVNDRIREIEEAARRHPVAEPALHDKSPEGLRAVSVDEFLAHVQAILIQANLI